MKALRLFGDEALRPARERRPGHGLRPARRERECPAATDTELKRPRALAREGRTLEDIVSGAWEDLASHRTATCPICAGELAPQPGSGPGAVAGRCRSCGTTLG